MNIEEEVTELRDSLKIWQQFYEERTDDCIELCEALRAVYALTGEDEKVKKIIEEALDEHGL